jgi:hypothetical protein
MPIGPRRIENIIRNLNPKVFFTNTLGSEADSFVHIGTNIVMEEDITPQYGFFIKNISFESNFYVKYSDLNHGNDDGFFLSTGESLFLECKDYSKIQVKRQTATTALSLEVIGY